MGDPFDPPLDLGPVLREHDEAVRQLARATENPPKPRVSDLNALLKLNLYATRSFRADVRVDFDEHGRILTTTLLNPDALAGYPAEWIHHDHRSDPQ